jgi:HTH-type transcriptional regulator / antitoxin HipB
MTSRSPPSSQTLVTALQLGQLLKTARKQRKITQAQVASRLGLSQNRVSHLEQHPEELSFKQLLAWCAVIGLELRLGEREPSDWTNKADW